MLVHAKKILRGIAAVALVVNLSGSPSWSQDLSTTINSWIPHTGLGLTLDSVTLVGTADNSNVSLFRQQIVDNWVYPNGVVSDATATITDLQPISALGLSSLQKQSHLDLVTTSPFGLVTGDKIFQVNYTLSNPGIGVQTFSQLAYEDSAGNAKFEPWIYTTPLTGSNYIHVNNQGSSVDFSVSNTLFACASGHAELDISCDNAGHITRCDTLTSSSSLPLWDSLISHEPEKTFTKNGTEYCSTVVNFGFANGFKSIGLEANGYSISLSGSFGWAGTTSARIEASCAPEPGTLTLLALGIVGGIVARR